MNVLNNIIVNTIPLLPKFFVKKIAGNYVAGEHPSEVINQAKILNQKGYKVTIDLLGEHVKELTETDQVTNTYLNLLDEINKKSLDCNISVKPSHIGLDISNQEFFKNTLNLTKKAENLKNFIRLDMESSTSTDKTISTFNEINDNFKNIGTVFQAYLRRTFDDISKFNKPINFRLCKGIYNESIDIAYKTKSEIDNNFLKITEYAFNNNHFIGLATHDIKLIKKIYDMIDKHNVDANNFEFQVLYGVPMHGWLQKHLKNNFKVRVYLPYGPQWYEYSIRRLKENPSIAMHVAKSIFSNRNY